MRQSDATWDDALRPGPGLRAQAARPEGAEVTVAGASMLPTLAVGAQVRVHARRPRIGDVIVFESAAGDRAVVHRVVWCAPAVAFVVHGGDAHRTPGHVSLIRARQVIGVADLPRRRPSRAQIRNAVRLVWSRLVSRAMRSK